MRRLLALVLACIPSLASAQARVTGLVTDSASGAPVRATVTVEPAARSAPTDSAGRFALGGLPAADATVAAPAFGYRASRVPVRLVVGSDAEVRVVLARVARELEAVRTLATRSAERTQAAAPTAPSVTSISTSELSMIPAVGQADVLRAAALLPGIAA